MKQKKGNTIIIVSRQVGTANAFSPLVRRFIEEGFSVFNFSFELAYHKYIERKIDSILITSFEQALSQLKNIPKPSLLLTGTSDFPEEDAFFWKWAKEKNIPSIAFVDSWVFYWQRFTSGGDERNKFDLIPDKIAVVDDLMYNKMVEFGCEKERLIITGNPNFDELREFPKNQSARIKKEIIEKYSNNYYLFAGEPFNQKVFGGDEKNSLGYTEFEAIELVLNALNTVGQVNNRSSVLVYKPHPRRLEREIKRLVSIKFSNVNFHISDYPAINLAVNSRAVFGMTSLLLFEAALLSVPSVSVRPNKQVVSDIIDGHSNIFTITSKEELVCRIGEILNEGVDRKGIGNAEVKRRTTCSNFLTFVYETIRKK